MIKFANLNISCLNKSQIFCSDDSFRMVITLNAEIIVLANELTRLKEIANRNLTTIDGTVPHTIIQNRNKVKFEKISGSDLIFDICEKAQNSNDGVFLLGGKEQANFLSQIKLSELYKCRINGFSPPMHSYPFPDKLNNEILSQIRACRPKYLLVGFGAPKQEYWIDDFREELFEHGVRVAVGVGGTFELTAGFEKRAPKWVQRIGLEQTWRLFQNPSRWRRWCRNFLILKYV